MLHVLRMPGSLLLFVTSCVARMPMTALGLLLVLHTQDLTGSYAHGGLAAAAYALALGVSSPVLGRVVDRCGQTVVLRACAPIGASAMVALALVPSGVPLAAIVALAAAAGAGQPPIGACMRALWPSLLSDPDDRHAAYSMESVALELVYICGPLIIVAGVASWSAPAALVLCAALVLAGNMAFSAQPASRHWLPHGSDRLDQRRSGALRHHGVRLLVGVFALCGLALGAVEVAVPAALDGFGQRDLTGFALGAWGAGSMVAGIVVGRLGTPRERVRRLAIGLTAWGAAHAAIALAQEPISLVLLLALAGATIAPTFVVANGMLDGIAPPGTLTEAFTWMSTGLAVGAALGSALGGVLVEAASPALALAALGGAAVVAAPVVRAAAAGALRGASSRPEAVTA